MSHQISRISGLDSLRGIAALMVVFCHFRLVATENFFNSPFFKLSPLHWLIDGHMAVIFFFVLSGFVLALPFQDHAQFSYKTFLVRRFFRIYSPFFVSILLAALLWDIFAAGHRVEIPWNSWGHLLNVSDLLSHLLATGMKGSDYLDPPVWTLIQEMRVAIIFPLLVYAVRKGGMAAVGLSIIVGYLAGKEYAVVEMGKDMYFADTLVGTILLTIYYIQFFVMGVYLALSCKQWEPRIEKVPSRIFIAVGAILFMVQPSALQLPYIVKEIYFALLGIFLIVICSKFKKVQSFLSFTPIEWLGKVSYSLYLTHVIIMMAMIYCLYNYLSIEIILFLAMPVILLSAHVIQKYVEAPSHGLGKKLTSAVVG